MEPTNPEFIRPPSTWEARRRGEVESLPPLYVDTVIAAEDAKGA